MPDAPDWDADRDYLVVLARLRLPGWLRAKADPSDVVQQALLRAHARGDQLRDSTPDGRGAWRRQILATVIADAARRYGADARLEWVRLCRPGLRPAHGVRRQVAHLG